jgi:hypothetical protein
MTSIGGLFKVMEDNTYPGITGIIPVKVINSSVVNRSRNYRRFEASHENLRFTTLFGAALDLAYF